MLIHSGGIDGFSPVVSFMPEKNVGVVVLINLGGGIPLREAIVYNVYDRILGLDQIPWNQRLLEQRAKTRENIKKARERDKESRKTGTKPSHPLEDYIGDFEDPGYGVVSVKMEDGHLKFTYHSMSSKLEHYHYDTFETAIMLQVTQ